MFSLAVRILTDLLSRDGLVKVPKAGYTGSGLDAGL